MELKNPLIPFGFFILSVLPLQATKAENPCSGKADFEVRLDQGENTLKDFKTIDQDGSGVCYAVSATTILKSILPDHPDLSYLDYAIQYKKNIFNDNLNQSLKQTRDLNRINKKKNKDPETILDGGFSMCDSLQKIQKTGFCPKDRVKAEKTTQDPNVAIGSLHVLNSFYDLKGKVSSDEFKSLLTGFKDYANQLKSETDKICNEFPSTMRYALKELYFEKQNESEELKKNYESELSQYQDVLKRKEKNEALKLELEAKYTQLTNEIDEITSRQKNEIDRLIEKSKKLPSRLLPKINEKKQNKTNAEYENLLSQPKQLEETQDQLRAFSDEIAKDQEIIRRAESAQAQIQTIKTVMDRIGYEKSDELIPDFKTIEFTADLEEKFKNQYRKLVNSKLSWDSTVTNFLKNEVFNGLDMDSKISEITNNPDYDFSYDQNEKDPESCLYAFENFYASIGDLRDDFFNKNQASCSIPTVKDKALDILQEIGKLMNADLHPENYFESLSSKTMTFDLMNSVIGSECKAEDRIKPNPPLKCEYHDFFTLASEQRNSGYRSSKFKNARLAELFNHASESLKAGRAIEVAFAGDYLNSGKLAKKYGIDDEYGHSVAMIGYACKSGKLRYMIQNSWGYSTSSNSSHEDIPDRPGAFWADADEMIENVKGFSVVGQ